MATEDLSSPAYSSPPVTPILNTSDAERAIEEVTASVDRIFASTMGSLDLAEDARSINPEQDLRRRLGLLPGSVPGFDGPEQPQEEVSNVTECWPCSDCSFRPKNEQA